MVVWPRKFFSEEKKVGSSCLFLFHGPGVPCDEDNGGRTQKNDRFWRNVGEMGFFSMRKMKQGQKKGPKK